MGQKGTGRRLSDQERMEIISKLEGDKPRVTASECARQYGVSSAAITKLMKMKDKIKARFKGDNVFSQQRKRGGTERHAAFEDELYQWIVTQQQQQQLRASPPDDQERAREHPHTTFTATDEEREHPPAAVYTQRALEEEEEEEQGSPPPPPPGGDAAAVTPKVEPGSRLVLGGRLLTAAKVQEKAQELLKAHDLGTFRASKGWYYRFCRRYGLSRTSLSAESSAGGTSSSHGADADADADAAMEDRSDADTLDDVDSDGTLDADDSARDGAAGRGSASSSVRRNSGKRKAEGELKRPRAAAAPPAPSAGVSGGGWVGVQALCETLAKAAQALDHPEAREYLGDDAAKGMLRSIQQSITVVECIRIKKASMAALSSATAALEMPAASAEALALTPTPTGPMPLPEAAPETAEEPTPPRDAVVV
ncbi:hypothetical protein P43SY_004099 [Pythium insidiosum]|uniref:HTH CENPB-type domain-containing protein n=1 Tax=Pythium insidiosum TaxID=114742 RepID=A0AAD5M2U4_PYTIN|nr:hypothetical protein P43SY_004099 [Pythium insidiosum]